MDTPEEAIRAFAEFGSYLYFAGQKNGIIYRTADGQSFAAQAALGEYIYDLYVYGIYLLAARGEGENQIYRSTNGTAWNVSHNDAGLARVEQLLAFGAYCYGASTNLLSADFIILRSLDGVTWVEVENQTGGGAAHCFAVFGGKLYAGAGIAVGRVLRTSDGTTWTTAVTLPGVTSVEWLSVFGSYLYAGCSPAEIWRSADGSSWTQVATLAGLSFIAAMYVFKSQLFAVGVGDFLVYRSPDGETWIRDFDGAETVGAGMCEFGGELYAGTAAAGKVYRRY